MKNKNIIINLVVLGVYIFCGLANAGSPGGGNPYYDIRIYCEYLDKTQGKNVIFKLLNDDKTTVKVLKSMFIRHIDSVRYTVGEPTYSNLVNTCKEKIKEKSGAQGEFIGLKGTNAGNYEALTWYYPVLVR